MTSTRAIFGEVVRALAVLALVFLTFAPLPAVAGPAGYTAPGIDDFCGTPPDGHAGHLPCHACRATPALLPAPPHVAEVAFAVLSSRAPVVRTVVVAPIVQTAANPRGPPATV